MCLNIQVSSHPYFPEFVTCLMGKTMGKSRRNPLCLMGKTMVSSKFPTSPFRSFRSFSTPNQTFRDAEPPSFCLELSYFPLVTRFWKCAACGFERSQQSQAGLGLWWFSRGPYGATDGMWLFGGSKIIELIREIHLGWPLWVVFFKSISQLDDIGCI